MLPSVGPLELVIVAIIALIVLGPKKLPEFARSAGKGMREFKGALTGESKADDGDRFAPASFDGEDDVSDEEAARRYRAGIETSQKS